ncbi:hypothetical protein GW17_00015995 [Ensete ventricosum]|uniref:Uncharacterized protein n=1 Tax=Ensete ventricosum TaxID=4639 RepID=A0A444FBF2_ENSVE|nr:hypothetical protein GW17_00015995 [Ensete ventricosum]RZR71206.1 hypothetical protein BHM03_00004179 [Ensete ventricosum]
MATILDDRPQTQSSEGIVEMIGCSTENRPHPGSSPPPHLEISDRETGGARVGRDLREDPVAIGDPGKASVGRGRKKRNIETIDALWGWRYRRTALGASR